MIDRFELEFSKRNEIFLEFYWFSCKWWLNELTRACERKIRLFSIDEFSDWHWGRFVGRSLLLKRCSRMVLVLERLFPTMNNWWNRYFRCLYEFVEICRTFVEIDRSVDNVDRVEFLNKNQTYWIRFTLIEFHFYEVRLMFDERIEVVDARHLFRLLLNIVEFDRSLVELQFDEDHSIGSIVVLDSDSKVKIMKKIQKFHHQY